MNINKIKKAIKFNNNSYTHAFGYVKDYVLKVGNIKIQVRREKNKFNKNTLDMNVFKNNILLFNI